MARSSKIWILWHFAALMIWIAEFITFIMVMPHLNERSHSSFYRVLEIFTFALFGWFISALSTAFNPKDSPWMKVYKPVLLAILIIPAAVFTKHVVSAVN